MPLARSLRWGIEASLTVSGYDGGEFASCQSDRGLDCFVNASFKVGSSDKECGASFDDGSSDGKRHEAGLLDHGPGVDDEVDEDLDDTPFDDGWWAGDFEAGQSVVDFDGWLADHGLGASFDEGGWVGDFEAAQYVGGFGGLFADHTGCSRAREADVHQDCHRDEA